MTGVTFDSYPDSADKNKALKYYFKTLAAISLIPNYPLGEYKHHELNGV